MGVIQLFRGILNGYSDLNQSICGIRVIQAGSETWMHLGAVMVPSTRGSLTNWVRFLRRRWCFSMACGGFRRGPNCPTFRLGTSAKPWKKLEMDCKHLIHYDSIVRWASKQAYNVNFHCGRITFPAILHPWRHEPVLSHHYAGWVFRALTSLSAQRVWGLHSRRQIHKGEAAVAASASHPNQIYMRMNLSKQPHKT